MCATPLSGGDFERPDVRPRWGPPEIEEVPGYDFFKIDPVSGVARELSDPADEKIQRDFWRELDHLAHDRGRLGA